MKIKLETEKARFNRNSLGRAWSIPTHIKLVIQNRRSWENGLTAKKLTLEVKRSLRNIKLTKKANRLKVGSIYGAITKINLLSDPVFYVRCDNGILPSGKYEYRYFVPVTDDDIQKEKAKQERTGLLKLKKRNNVEDFGKELEIEKETQQISMLQEVYAR